MDNEGERKRYNNKLNVFCHITFKLTFSNINIVLNWKSCFILDIFLIMLDDITDVSTKIKPDQLKHNIGG